MKKTIPFMLTIIAIASIASTAVLGNTQTAYAGTFCNLSPTEVTLTLDKGESSEVITKIVDCDNTISLITQAPFDCNSKGIDVTLENQQLFLGQFQVDETLTNTGGAPGETLCEITFDIEIPGDPNVFLVQQVRITTPEPEPTVVGGEMIPIETTALILAGAQTFSWMIPVIVSAVGIGIVIARKF